MADRFKVTDMAVSGNGWRGGQEGFTVRDTAQGRYVFSTPMRIFDWDTAQDLAAAMNRLVA